MQMSVCAATIVQRERGHPSTWITTISSDTATMISGRNFSSGGMIIPMTPCLPGNRYFAAARAAASPSQGGENGRDDGDYERVPQGRVEPPTHRPELRRTLVVKASSGKAMTARIV